MQVICSQCGAKYEFDAAAIPAAGYEAQCTTCSHIFFVAPEKAPEPAAQVTVSCTSCGATYQFAASAIPQGGYDAQCTQCQAVFFVAGPAMSGLPVVTSDMGALGVGSAQVSQPTTAFEPVEPMAPMAPMEPIPPIELAEAQPEEVIEEPVLLDNVAGGASVAGEPAVGLSPSALPSFAGAVPVTQPIEQNQQIEQIDLEAASPLPPVNALGLAPDVPTPLSAEAAVGLPASQAVGMGDPVVAVDAVFAGAAPSASGGGEKSPADLVALGASLGDAAETASEPASDFAAIMTKRRWRLRVGIGVLAALCVGVAVMYFFVPRAFDLSIGRVVGVRLTVDPEAVPFVEQARKRLLDDSIAAYGDAMVQLEKALALDDQYPEAMALAAVVHTLRGMDAQAAGKEVFDRGAQALAAYKALEAQQSRPADGKNRLEALRREIAEANAASTRLFEEGGKDLSAAQQLLRLGLKIGAGNAVVAEAAGIYFAADSDAVSRAEEQLKRAMRLSVGEGATLDLAKPPDALAPFLQARIWAWSKLDRDRAQQAFAAALAAEPRFQRARYELATELVRVGRTSEAKKLLEEVLAAVPDHEKAKALLPKLSESRAAASASPAQVEADKGNKGASGTSGASGASGASDPGKGRRKAKNKRRN